MDFTLSEEQQALVNVTRQFAQKELADYADKIEKTGLPAPRILLQRCLLYTSPSPRDLWISRMPSSA